jgi:hypothetical protein
MGHLYLYVTEYLEQQKFLGIVRAHNRGLNIAYFNDNPIEVQISNINNNPDGLINKVVDIIIQSENPIIGTLDGYVTGEASIIQFL